ncbi:hypothetical protein HDU81_004525 [Chytriomyces hyalinus]|nr:hypothetical protein HDU81_004525 [Chytriomyces hyalinus]
MCVVTSLLRLKERLAKHFGPRFDCSSQTIWIQCLMKAEEAFSVGPSYATTSPRHPDLAEDFRPQLMEMVFSDAQQHSLPRELGLLDVYLLCLLMAELHCCNDRSEYTELIWEDVLERCSALFYPHECSFTLWDGLKNAYALPFDWNLGCPTVLDWLQTDATALEFDKIPSIPDKKFVAAFFLLENLLQSCEVTVLPYSVIAAGVFKAVTVELMPDLELDSCLKFTGYDEQLYKVTRYIPDEVELEFRLECVVSVNPDVLVQAKYDVVEAEVVEPAALHADDDVVAAEAEVVLVEAEVAVAEAEVVPVEAEVVADEVEVLPAEAEVPPIARVKKERVRRGKRIAAKVPPRPSARIAAQK